MPITVPNLDDRDFEGLLREVLARVPVHTPEWTNLTDNDPGTTLLQLFTFLVDNLSYRSNRIPEATRRAFLTLLGMGLRPATAATGFVSFAAEGTAAVVPEGTVVRAGKVPFRTRRSVNTLPVEAHVFWKRSRGDLDAATLEHLRRLHGPFVAGGAAGLVFYDPVTLEPPATGVPATPVDLSDTTTGPVDGSLWVALATTPTAVRAAGNAPEAAVAALRPIVAGQTLTLGVLPGADPDGEVLAPRRAVTTTTDGGLVVDAAAPGSAPTYQRLAITWADEVLERPGVIDVELPPLERLTGPWSIDAGSDGTGDLPPTVQDAALAARIVTWLRIRRRWSAAGAAAGGASIAWVGANVASIVQAVRVDHERAGVGTGAPDQQVRLAHGPILLDDPALPAVEVQGPTGAWETWARTDQLYAAGPDDRVYAVDAEAGVIRFGSGLHGHRPPLRAAIRVTYEHGGGAEGVVPIGAISSGDGLPPGTKVLNPVATWGGAPGESVAEAERSIPAWLRHRDRAVTAADFRDIVLRTPGVDLARVDVLPLFDPRPSAVGDPTDAAGAVTVLVVPRADVQAAVSPPVDPQVLDAVCGWLDGRRLLTTRVFVRGARWVPVVVSIGVALMPGEVREEVEQRARSAITRYLSPLDGGLGVPDSGIAVEGTGVSPHGWPLGVSLRVDDLGAAATRVHGVRYVEGVRLAATRDGSTVSDVTEVTLTGLELPKATVFVTAGPPEDPRSLLADRLPGADLVPVPVVPRSC